MKRASVGLLLGLLLVLLSSACDAPRSLEEAAPPVEAAAAASPPEKIGPLAIPSGLSPYGFRDDELGRHLLDDMTDCVSRGSCPASDEGKARRKAGRAFGCAPEAVDASLRTDVVLDVANRTKETFTLSDTGQSFFFATGGSIESARGYASLLVQQDSAAVVQVACNGAWGVVVCITGNRTVRTPDTTYENTADRVCLWGRPTSGRTSTRSPSVRDEAPLIR